MVPFKIAAFATVNYQMNAVAAICDGDTRILQIRACNKFYVPENDEELKELDIKDLEILAQDGPEQFKLIQSNLSGRMFAVGTSKKSGSEKIYTWEENVSEGHMAIEGLTEVPVVDY